MTRKRMSIRFPYQTSGVQLNVIVLFSPINIGREVCSIIKDLYMEIS